MERSRPRTRSVRAGTLGGRWPSVDASSGVAMRAFEPLPGRTRAPRAVAPRETAFDALVALGADECARAAGIAIADVAVERPTDVERRRRPFHATGAALDPDLELTALGRGQCLAGIDVHRQVRRDVALDALSPARVDSLPGRERLAQRDERRRQRLAVRRRQIRPRRRRRAAGEPRVARAEPCRRALPEGDGVAQRELVRLLAAIGLRLRHRGVGRRDERAFDVARAGQVVDLVLEGVAHDRSLQAEGRAGGGAIRSSPIRAAKRRACCCGAARSRCGSRRGRTCRRCNSC